MKYLTLIISISLLLLSCTEEKEEPACIESVPFHTLLHRSLRPSIDTLSGFMEISDTVHIEEKVFRYSIFLPKTFDTVFKQGYGGCTYSTMRTLYTSRAYAIEPEISTFLHIRDKEDSLFYVAIAHDTVSTQIINEERRLKLEQNRRLSRKAERRTVKLDTSYLVRWNKSPILITERAFSDKCINFELQIILNDVLFKVDAVYEGELAMEMREQLKIAIESFEVKQL